VRLAVASFARASPRAAEEELANPLAFFRWIFCTNFATSDASDAFNLTAFLANFKAESKSSGDFAEESFSLAMSMHREASSAFISLFTTWWYSSSSSLSLSLSVCVVVTVVVWSFIRAWKRCSITDDFLPKRRRRKLLTTTRLEPKNRRRRKQKERVRERKRKGTRYIVLLKRFNNTLVCIFQRFSNGLFLFFLFYSMPNLKVTANLCASKPSTSAILATCGPKFSMPSFVNSWTVMYLMKESKETPEYMRLKP